jgi:multicomponent Na+:H+ antiporter subunit C
MWQLGLYNYWMVIILLMTGLYVLMAKQNLIKKVIGLNVFQSSVIIFYITMGKVSGGTAPIFPLEGEPPPGTVYSNPVPHVLMLTAIVVGIATTALALALVVRIHEAFGTIEEDEIRELEGKMPPWEEPK